MSSVPGSPKSPGKLVTLRRIGNFLGGSLKASRRAHCDEEEFETDMEEIKRELSINAVRKKARAVLVERQRLRGDLRKARQIQKGLENEVHTLGDCQMISCTIYL